MNFTEVGLHIFYIGNHGSSKKKKKNSTRFGEGIGNNPFLQQSINLSTVQSNPFLLNFFNNNNMSQPGVMPNMFLPQFFGNKSESQNTDIAPNIFLPQENSSIIIEIFTNSNNPFLSSFGSGTKVDPTSIKPAPVTQSPYAPSSSYPSDSHQAPSDNASKPNTPVPFTSNEATPVKVGPPASTPSLTDLIGVTRPRSERSKHKKKIIFSILDIGKIIYYIIEA